MDEVKPFSISNPSIGDSDCLGQGSADDGQDVSGTIGGTAISSGLVDHDLMLKAVDHHNPPTWVRLYVERWLKAPARSSDGKVWDRTTGTPQGGVISPLLANLFLHYAFDTWMVRNHPGNPFERYADDVVIHYNLKKPPSLTVVMS